MFKDLSSEERKTLIVWAIIGIIIFMIAVLFKIFIVNDGARKEYNNPYEIVKDHSRYYTVTTALNKYYSFINAKNYKSVINILDSKYVSEAKITEDNINEFITVSDIALSYRSGMMCYKDTSEGITSYLIKGEETGMNTAKKIKVAYYEVILDGNNLLFSVKPITEDTFGGNCHE